MTHTDLVNVLHFLNRGNEWVVCTLEDGPVIKEWLCKQPQPTPEEIEATIKSPEFTAYVEKKKLDAEERTANLSKNNIKDLFAEMVKIVGLEPTDPRLAKAREIVNNVK